MTFLDGSYGSEGCTHLVDGISPSLHQLKGPLRRGAGGEVVVGDLPFQESVPHRAPHQVQLLPDLAEDAGELGGGKLRGSEEFEPLRDHGGQVIGEHREETGSLNRLSDTTRHLGEPTARQRRRRP